MRLKARLATFSAVLLSGGMASLYFVTYAAYDFYELIPQAFAFALMVLFTAFTVFAAIRYDMQVIAIIGLVGAYGVPFLLSDGSGRVVILFSYVAIINAGILVIAFRKSWAALYYLAFFLTWTIFSLWWMGDYNADKFLWQSLTFSTLFFVIFYITLLAHKVMRDEPFDRLDAVLLLFNSFLYFAFGYQSINQLIDGEMYLACLLCSMPFFTSWCAYCCTQKERHNGIHSISQQGLSSYSSHSPYLCNLTGVGYR